LLRDFIHSVSPALVFHFVIALACVVEPNPQSAPQPFPMMTWQQRTVNWSEYSLDLRTARYAVSPQNGQGLSVSGWGWVNFSSRLSGKSPAYLWLFLRV
jgi:hypothetical protein